MDRGRKVGVILKAFNVKQLHLLLGLYYCDFNQGGLDFTYLIREAGQKSIKKP